MSARLLAEVIYHNYIVLLWGGARGNTKLVKCASGHLRLVAAGTEESTV